MDKIKVGDKVIIARLDDSEARSGCGLKYKEALKNKTIFTVKSIKFGSRYNSPYAILKESYLTPYISDLKLANMKHFKSLPSDYTGTIEVKNGFIKEILDTAEKEYLSAVISPFRDKVKAINKTSICGDEFIRIDSKNEPAFSLPNFKAETMYKGMELCKEYSLEELGLDA